jgi:prevent-host-death family protein
MAPGVRGRRDSSVWQLHEAKARFSELFRRVRAHGPQRVVKQGGEAVVVVPAEEFDRLSERAAQPASLVEFFRSAPTGGKRLDLTRKRDTTRGIKW